MRIGPNPRCKCPLSQRRHVVDAKPAPLRQLAELRREIVRTARPPVPDDDRDGGAAELRAHAVGFVQDDLVGANAGSPEPEPTILRSPAAVTSLMIRSNAFPGPGRSMTDISLN